MKNNPWQENLIQDSVTIKELYKLAIKSGMLAPSTHNSQPWEVKISYNNVKLFDVDKKIEHADPENNYKWLSIGGFIENFSVCTNYYGYETLVSVNDKSIDLSVKKNSRVKNELLKQVTRRYSEKRLFYSKDMNSGVFSDLSSIKGVSFISKDKTLIDELSIYQYEAARSFKDNKYFAREISHWLKIRKSIDEGMHSKSSGLTHSKLIIGKFALKITPKVLDKMSLKYKYLVARSSAVGCISITQKSKLELINAGRTLEKLSLIATSHDLSVTPLAAIIENKTTAGELRNLQKDTSNIPVIFFRVGEIEKTNLPYSTKTI